MDDDDDGVCVCVCVDDFSLDDYLIALLILCGKICLGMELKQGRKTEMEKKQPIFMTSVSLCHIY